MDEYYGINSKFFSDMPGTAICIWTHIFSEAIQLPHKCISNEILIFNDEQCSNFKSVV